MANTNTTLHECGLIRFSKKTGKVDTTLTGLGYGMLKMWGLQNTTKTKATIVMDLVSHSPIVEYVGTADGFPDIHTDVESMQFNLPDELYDELMKSFNQ